MKALTVYQPWASLIALGVKPFEFRAHDYAARNSRVGGARIAIHASARPPKYKEIIDLCDRMAGVRVRPAPATPMGSLGGTGDAPMRADIEIRCNPPGQPAAVCVSIGGKDYAVLASEARTIADIFEKALNADPEIGKAEGFPNFIMGLRAGADKADATV